MMTHRSYQHVRRDMLSAPTVQVLQIHDHDCDCPSCAPYALRDAHRLGAVAMGKLATAGAATATLIAFLYDPAAAAAALLATLGL